jgi:hypothetical protein
MMFNRTIIALTEKGKTMAEIAYKLGEIFMIFGGVLATTGCLFLLGFMVESAWILFSDTFRAICKAESLIFEYRKNRDAFLKWREGANNV